MPFNLYIDTSGAKSTILLFDENNNIAIRNNEIQNDHSKFINLHIEQVMNELKITWTNLQSICVLNGPGSYTGLRISLATAKGICYAHSIPLILINKLDLLAHAYQKPTNNFGAILEAREKEYYFASYAVNKENITPPLSIFYEELKNQNIELISSEDIIFDNNQLVKKIVIDDNDIFSFCFYQNQHKIYADLFNSEPFYLKNVHINKINKL